MANTSSHLVIGFACLALCACGGDSGNSGNEPSNAGGASSSGSPATTGGDPPSGGVNLTVAFNPMYSAYDGVHTFSVPVKVTGSSGKLTVTSTPPDFVDSSPSADGVTLVTKKAGKATITIKDAEGNSGSAELTVTKNDPEDVDIGKQRYANGIDALPPNFNLMDSGIRLADASIFLPDGALNPGAGAMLREAGAPIRNEMAACTFCHIPEGASGVVNAEMLRVDVEHTPQQTAGYSDDALISIFAQGRKPEGAGFRVVNGGGLLQEAAAAQIYMMFHRWNVDEATRTGLIAYLRSITPKPQGPIDFGGLLSGAMRAGLTPPGFMPAMDAGAP